MFVRLQGMLQPMLHKQLAFVCSPSMLQLVGKIAAVALEDFWHMLKNLAHRHKVPTNRKIRIIRTFNYANDCTRMLVEYGCTTHSPSDPIIPEAHQPHLITVNIASDASRDGKSFHLPISMLKSVSIYRIIMRPLW